MDHKIILRVKDSTSEAYLSIQRAWN